MTLSGEGRLSADENIPQKRNKGTDTAIMIPAGDNSNVRTAFTHFPVLRFMSFNTPSFNTYTSSDTKKTETDIFSVKEKI